MYGYLIDFYYQDVIYLFKFKLVIFLKYLRKWIFYELNDVVVVFSSYKEVISVNEWRYRKCSTEIGETKYNRI